MANSVLTNTSLVVNGTQSITGIETTMNDSDTELLTSGGVLRYIINSGILPEPQEIVILDQFTAGPEFTGFSFSYS